jgi:hypothetical protein
MYVCTVWTVHTFDDHGSKTWFPQEPMARCSTGIRRRASERFGRRHLTTQPHAFCSFRGMGEGIDLVPLRSGRERMGKDKQRAGLCGRRVKNASWSTESIQGQGGGRMYMYRPRARCMYKHTLAGMLAEHEAPR